MSRTADQITYAVIEVMLGYADAQIKAGELLKQAHDEGRTVTLDELRQIRSRRPQLLARLDAVIEEAEKAAQGNG